MLAVCACLCILVFVGAVYYSLLMAEFIGSDDHHYVNAGRSWARHIDDCGAVFTHGRIHKPTGTGGYYQPLTILSLMLDAYLVADWNAASYQFHLTNIALHLLNVLLVFVIVRRLSRSLVWPVLLSLGFALHPVQVESVAWIAQRMTLLGASFTLLALYCYVRYGQTGRVRWYWPVVPCYAAAVLCRPLFIALPVVLLVLNIWPYRRVGWRPIVEKIPLMVIAVLAALVQSEVRDFAESPRVGGAEGVGLISHSVAALAARLFWPVALSPHQPISTTVGGVGLGLWFDVVVIVAIVGALVWSFRLSKPVFAAVCGAMLLVLPALLEAPHGDLLLSDQYLYAALVMPILAFAAWLGMHPGWLHRLRGRWVAISLAAVLSIFAVESYSQAMTWENARSLHARTTRLFPDWYFGHVGLVQSCIDDSAYDEALHIARRAVALAPDEPTTQYYLGTVLLLHHDGRSAEAIEPLKRALAATPGWIDCLRNLGMALGKSGRHEEAIEYLQAARDLEPRSAGIRVGLGYAYLKVERFASARGEFAEALRHQNTASVHLGLAIAWAGNEMPDRARRHLAAAVAKDPGFAERAGRSPELLRYRDHPGFEELLETGGHDDAALIGSPAPLPRGS